MSDAAERVRRHGAEQKSGAAAVAILALGLATRWASGSIYSAAKAIDLIHAVRSPALYLGGALATSSATTLALMLTLVAFVRRVDHDFSRDTYKRVRTIARLSAIALAGSVLLLLSLTFPVGQFDELPTHWYPWLFNVIFAMVVALSALVVGTVTLLFMTLSDLIAQITPTD